MIFLCVCVRVCVCVCINLKGKTAPQNLNDSIQCHLESIKHGLNLNKRHFSKRTDLSDFKKDHNHQTATTKVVDDKLYLEIYMPCMS